MRDNPLRGIKEFLEGFFGAFKHQSTEYLEFELRELENVFALILMGSFVGIPSPPTTLVIRLLPHMERELRVMHERAVDMDDLLGELAGMFEIT
ncbi:MULTISPECIES: hypothetical protein [Thermococcus]|uniref:Uncharacterized protein n=1 Tax=Thermococcus nautili TaxID=195522 RepID=W8P143_9EURY|nr:MULTISPECIES: hypothetical protein [Thermococcus]AHL22461.1 hypothetical protein BD01_0839 [Thermococcus nautili]NJE48291.1 hypothetical protein [Thermococcus sp. 9N3]CAI1493492.1 conserved protein of unknown function [Thermococcus nautili]